MSKKVFISYSSTDDSYATKVCEYLEKNDISCFMAPRDLMPGKVYGEEIIRGINECEVLLLLASKNALGSQHVLREVERAVGRNMPLVVYKTEDFAISEAFEYFIMICQWVDATEGDRIAELPQIIREISSESKKDSKKETVQLPKEDDAESTSGNQQVEQKSQTNVQNHQQDNGATQDKQSINWTKGVIFAVLLIAAICLLGFFGRKLSGGGTLLSELNQGNTTVDTNHLENEQAGITSLSNEIVKNLKVGDTVILGAYNGQPIEWVVLCQVEDGAFYLITKDIITLKAFDAPKGGKWNYISDTEKYDPKQPDIYSDAELIYAKGSNAWESSTVRTWLNSSEVKVTYADHAPTAKSYYSSKMGYDKEAGFLTNFSAEELAVIQKNGEDTVFLPSQEEVSKYIINGDVMFAPAVPTKEALAADVTGEALSFSQQYDGYYPWLTRTADTARVCDIITVLGADYSSQNTDFSVLQVDGAWGVRPAILVKP